MYPNATSIILSNVEALKNGNGKVASKEEFLKSDHTAGLACYYNRVVAELDTKQLLVAGDVEMLDFNKAEVCLFNFSMVNSDKESIADHINITSTPDSDLLSVERWDRNGMYGQILDDVKLLPSEWKREALQDCSYRGDFLEVIECNYSYGGNKEPDFFPVCSVWDLMSMENSCVFYSKVEKIIDDQYNWLNSTAS